MLQTHPLPPASAASAASAPRTRDHVDLTSGAPRFELQADRTSAIAHRSRLVVALSGLSNTVSVNLVDDSRNLALWDRRTGRLVSDDYLTLERDLATHYGDRPVPGRELYPRELRADIDELDRWLGRAIEQGPSRLAPSGNRAAADARALLIEAFARVDRTLSHSRHLLGERLTLADVRLWVHLVRFGADAGRAGRISAELQRFTSLWAYAQNLYEREEFRSTTHPEALRRPWFG